MIVSKQTLYRRFHSAYWSVPTQRHLHDVVALAKRDPEYARQQIDVLLQFVARHVVEGGEAPPKWIANSRPPEDAT